MIIGKMNQNKLCKINVKSRNALPTNSKIRPLSLKKKVTLKYKVK